jgi:hypothetical protein
VVIAYYAVCSRPVSVMENMPRDEEIHLDLAILMVIALFDASVQGAHNPSIRDPWFIRPLLAADKNLFCQILSRLYVPDDANENKLRTLKLLMKSFKQVCYSVSRASLSLLLGHLLTGRDIRTNIFQKQPPKTRSSASASCWRRNMLRSSSR